MEQQKTTVNQILDRYEAECLDELAPRTQRDYRKNLVHLRRWFGDRIADELKPRDFGPFLNVKRGYYNRVKMLAILSSAFTNAVNTFFLLDRNVLRDVKRKPGKPRDRLISDAEFKSCRAMAPLPVQLAMDIALITGQRQGDILGMRWDQIKDGAWHLQQAKTGKRLAIGLSHEFKKVLGKCAALPCVGERARHPEHTGPTIYLGRLPRGLAAEYEALDASDRIAQGNLSRSQSFMRYTLRRSAHRAASSWPQLHKPHFKNLSKRRGARRSAVLTAARHAIVRGVCAVPACQRSSAAWGVMHPAESFQTNPGNAVPIATWPVIREESSMRGSESTRSPEGSSLDGITGKRAKLSLVKGSS
jgi:integrase